MTPPSPPPDGPGATDAAGPGPGRLGPAVAVSALLDLLVGSGSGSDRGSDLALGEADNAGREELDGLAWPPIHDRRW